MKYGKATQILGAMLLLGYRTISFNHTSDPMQELIFHVDESPYYNEDLRVHYGSDESTDVSLLSIPSVAGCDLPAFRIIFPTGEAVVRIIDLLRRAVENGL